MKRRKLRVVAYAINGSGVGHLTRLVAIARWLRRYARFLGVECEVYFLSSSEADGLLFAEGFASFKLPSKTAVREAGIDKLAYLALAKQWVWHSLGLLRPDLLVVDTFPRGSFGELLSALDLCRRKAFVYRPLKDDFAGRADFQAMLPLYDAILVPDDPEVEPVQAPPSARPALRHVGPVMAREASERLERAEARRRLGVPEASLCVYVTGGGGGDATCEARLLEVRDALAGEPDVHAVVGAGPLYRGQRRHGPGVTWLAGESAAELAAAFDVAVTAAGYNSFFELMHAGVPCLLLPQEKVADDQERRARRAVEAGAGWLLAGPAWGEAVRTALAPLRDPAARAAAAAAARALVPTNNARAAAGELLRLLLPEEEVDAAEDAVDDALLAAARDLDLDVGEVRAVIDLLAGGEDPSPAQAAGAAPHALRLLARIAALEAPRAAGLRVVGPLVRKLVRATPAQRADAACQVLDALAPFGDWPGAAMLLKAFRVEKELGPARFADALAGFLQALRRDGHDLYAGIARLSGAQGAGDELPTNLEMLRAAGGAP